MSRQQGFILAELLISLGIGVTLALMVCTACSRLLPTWDNIRSDLELRDAGRYMLANVERELGYNSKEVSLKRKWDGSTVVAGKGVRGNRDIRFECEAWNLYKYTDTSDGEGKNPLFLPDYRVDQWQVEAVDQRTLLVRLKLGYKLRKQSFVKLVFLLNGKVVTDE